MNSRTISTQNLISNSRELNPSQILSSRNINAQGLIPNSKTLKPSLIPNSRIPNAQSLIDNSKTLSQKEWQQEKSKIDQSLIASNKTVTNQSSLENKIQTNIPQNKISLIPNSKTKTEPEQRIHSLIPNSKTIKLKNKNISINKHTKLKKKLKRINRNKVRVFAIHKPKEMVDINYVPDLGGRGGADTTPTKEKSKSGPGTRKTQECGAETPRGPQSRDIQTHNYDKTLEEERTFNIEIIGEMNIENEATNGSIRSRNEEETIRYDIEETQDSNTEIDINDIILINKIYKKYIKNPKEPEVGGEDIDLEILLVNSLKINAGKIQEIVTVF